MPGMECHFASDVSKPMRLPAHELLWKASLHTWWNRFSWMNSQCFSAMLYVVSGINPGWIPVVISVEPICHVRQGCGFGSKLGPIENISNLARVHHSE